MALPTHFGDGTFTAAAGAITPPFPASTVADDIALCVVTTENQATSLATPNGFVEIPTWSPQSAGTAATDPGIRMAVYWKRLVGGDSAPVTNDSGDHQCGQIHVFRGCITTGDPWSTGSGGNDGGLNDTSGVIPASAGSTSVADCLVVLLEASSRNTTSTANFSGWTNGDLANILERTDNTNTIGLGGGHGMATGEKATAGTYGATTVTHAITTFHASISLALKPPAAAGAAPQVIWMQDGMG